MAKYLKADTAATIKIGPFVDSTDGVTAETGLTIAQADVRLAKNGGNIAQKSETTACTHDELGYYDCPLGTGDTDTEGTLSVFVSESGALPVRHDFIVLPAKVYDSLVTGDDNLEVDVIQQLGTAVTNVYQARFVAFQGAEGQTFAASWFRGGAPVAITSPTIQITTLAESPANLLDTGGDGADAMLVVGSSNAAFLLDEADPLTPGVVYRFVVTASIDSATRTFQDTFMLTANGVPLTVQQIADAIWRQSGAQMGGHESSAGSDSAAALLRDTTQVLASLTNVQESISAAQLPGTTEAGGSTTAFGVNFNVPVVANALKDRVIVFPDGSLPSRRITANTVGDQSTLTVSPALPEAPDGSVDVIVLGYVEPAS